ncbi:hypothetical protein N0M98_27090 [Paenibacillus doosanensis]|nr:MULTISPECIES: hypothetical protein [Paenibacillus]MCS7463775.1 hypothetical protein [Paenibacillus doosanensis]
MDMFIFVFVCVFIAGYLFINMFDNSRRSAKEAVRKKLLLSLFQAVVISGLVQIILHS